MYTKSSNTAVSSDFNAARVTTTAPGKTYPNLQAAGQHNTISGVQKPPSQSGMNQTQPAVTYAMVPVDQSTKKLDESQHQPDSKSLHYPKRAYTQPRRHHHHTRKHRGSVTSSTTATTSDTYSFGSEDHYRGSYQRHYRCPTCNKKQRYIVPPMQEPVYRPPPSWSFTPPTPPVSPSCFCPRHSHLAYSPRTLIAPPPAPFLPLSIQQQPPPFAPRYPYYSCPYCQANNRRMDCAGKCTAATTNCAVRLEPSLRAACDLIMRPFYSACEFLTSLTNSCGNGCGCSYAPPAYPPNTYYRIPYQRPIQAIYAPPPPPPPPPAEPVCLCPSPCGSPPEYYSPQDYPGSKPGVLFQYS